MPTRTSVRSGSRLPLVVTGDPDLLDDLLRLAAAGGTDVEVASDPAAARPRFAAAPMVMVGADQAEPCLRARLPRRPRIVIVGRSPAMESAWEVAELLGAEHVAVLPTAEPWLVDRFADRPGQANAGHVIAVIGGRGGAGASILAGGLAVTAVNAGLRTLLIDADPLGGGLDLVLGWEQVDGLRWPALMGAGGRVDPPALLRALPHRGDLVLLSFARDAVEANPLLAVPGEAMAATLDAAQRGRDMIIVDLPRQLDDAAVLALQAASRTLLVVPAELRATAAGARIAASVALHCENLAVVVRGPAPGRLKAREMSRGTKTHTQGLPMKRAEHTHCAHPATRAARDACRKAGGPGPGAVQGFDHANCEHPNTSYARRTCPEKLGPLRPRQRVRYVATGDRDHAADLTVTASDGWKGSAFLDLPLAPPRELRESFPD